MVLLFSCTGNGNLPSAADLFPQQLSLTTVLMAQSDLAMVGHSPPGACNEGSGKSVSFRFFFSLLIFPVKWNLCVKFEIFSFNPNQHFIQLLAHLPIPETHRNAWWTGNCILDEVVCLWCLGRWEPLVPWWWWRPWFVFWRQRLLFPYELYFFDYFGKFNVIWLC